VRMKVFYFLEPRFSVGARLFDFFQFLAIFSYPQTTCSQQKHKPRLGKMGYFSFCGSADFRF